LARPFSIVMLRAPFAGASRVSVHELVFYRGGNWWDSKIPPLLAIAYVQMLIQPIPADLALGALAAVLISAFSLAAYAHTLNDLFDIEADLLAGKKNHMAGLRPWQRLTLPVLLAAVGAAPWFIIRLNEPTLILLGLIYLLPIVYAVPPIRFKERGFLGVLNDASLVHAVPVLFMVSLFTSVAGSANVIGLPVMVGVGIWAAAVGLRGIILHEVWDWQNDFDAGASTWVVQVGVDRALAFVRHFIFPVEMVAFAALALTLLSWLPVLFWVLVGIVLLDTVKRPLGWAIRFDPAPRDPEGVEIPPHAVYQTWLPLVAAALLASRDIWYVPLLLAHVVLFRESILGRGLAVAILLRQLTFASTAGLRGFVRQSLLRESK
jgi:hypothetical protein